MNLVSRLSVAAALLVGAAASAQLTQDGAQFWTADAPDLSTESEESAWFGHALAVGDFDGDGYDDLAFGAPGRTVGAAALAGEVLVLYGGEGGLGADGHQVWNQDSPGIADAADANDFFGWSLAAGDFDGDGYDELVVAVLSEEIGGADGAGMVHVLPGGPGGLTATGSTTWHQDTIGIADAPEPGDQLGAALATGDFDEDGFEDLAIGVPGEDDEAGPVYNDLGAIHVIFGSAVGPTIVDARFYRPGDGVVPTPLPSSSQFFGAALAAGPILSNGEDQIYVGIPGLTVAGEVGAGGVLMFNLPEGGLTIFGFLTQDSTGVPGVAESGDNFGAALAIGKFDGNVRASLAVGSPGEDVEALGESDAGAIHLVRRLQTVDFDATLWLQDDVPPFASEEGDRFGSSFTVGDFDADGLDDLVVGVPLEDVGGGGGDFGAGMLLRGHAISGLTDAGAQYLPLGGWIVVPDLRFGAALAAGRFSGHSGSDLAIAAPRMDTPFSLASLAPPTPLPPDAGPLEDAGAVLVYSSIVLFRDGFESASTGRWSEAHP